MIVTPVVGPIEAINIFSPSPLSGMLGIEEHTAPGMFFDLLKVLSDHVNRGWMVYHRSGRLLFSSFA